MEIDRDSNQPNMGGKKFICPHCRVLAKQDWTDVIRITEVFNRFLTHLYLNYRQEINSFAQNYVKSFLDFLTSKISEIKSEPVLMGIPSCVKFAICQSCSKPSVWLEGEMIYPRSFPFPAPNEDMGDEIKELYLEAAKIFQDSPRASAALLRLCVEGLCRQLGEKGGLNACIGNLVNKGLDEGMQQALDYCRVIGNNAVHIGEIDVEEGSDKIPTLFYLVNDIAQEMITKPKERKEKYSFLPEQSRKQIERRDKEPE